MGAKTYFVYDPDGNPVEELNASGNVTALNVFAEDGLLERITSSDSTRYLYNP